MSDRDTLVARLREATTAHYGAHTVTDHASWCGWVEELLREAIAALSAPAGEGPQDERKVIAAWVRAQREDDRGCHRVQVFDVLAQAIERGEFLAPSTPQGEE